MFAKLLAYRSVPILNTAITCFSTSQVRLDNRSCKLLVVGGGSGGCTVAAKFAKDLRKGEIIVVEPSGVHYYQPMFTLIGGGIKTLKDAGKSMKSVLPKEATWMQDRVIQFIPKTNSVKLSNGDTISYEYMLVAVGLQLNYDQIPGLLQALTMPDSGVCSNYSPDYVNRTFEVLQRFESGNAVFTYPNLPVKCPGAPQKICYLTEDYLRRNGRRSKANIIYNTSLPVIFAVKKYADALWKVVKRRNINVNLRTNLIEIKPKKKIAVFENLDDPKLRTALEYSMLHVTPPMSAPNELKNCSELVNEAGFASVNKDTLQHTQFPNIFAIGDCGSTPNSKTAAAVSAQSKIVHQNMKSAMAGKKLSQIYNGYAACPLVTGYSSCILAEFDYDFKPLETFPISQDKEMWIMYLMKKNVLPQLYWGAMLKGNWNGPKTMRNLMHLQFKD